MIDNPFLPSPDQAAAWSEGFVKALAAVASPSPSDRIGPDDTDAFTQGVQAGATAQTNGIDLGISCVAAGERAESDGDSSMILHGIESTLSILYGLATHGLIGGLSEGLFSFFLMVAGGGTGTQPPANVLPDLGQPLVNQLDAMGAASFALFVGVGIDPGAAGCEFKLTPLFVRQDQAKQAAVATGRSSWLVVSWRTDASGSFTIVDSAG